MTEQTFLHEPRTISEILADSGRRSLIAILWSGTSLVGAILLLRRLAGTFTRELSVAEYFWLMLLFTGLIVLSQTALPYESADFTRSRRPRSILVLFLITLFIASLQPLTSLWGYLISLAALLAVFASAWSPRVIPDLIEKSSRHLHAWLPELFPPLPIPSPSVASPNFPQSVSSSNMISELDRNLASQLVRRIDSNSHSVEGTVLIHFPPGLKQTDSHIPFIPPLDSIANPRFESHENEVDVKLAAIYPYGMRLEARRSSADEPLTTPIHFELTIPTH